MVHSILTEIESGAGDWNTLLAFPRFSYSGYLYGDGFAMRQVF